MTGRPGTEQDRRKEDMTVLTVNTPAQDYVSSGILEDVLGQNGIPFMKKNVMGAGLAIKVGPMLDRSRFYVPFDRLESARDIADGLFSETAEEPEDGQEG